MPCRWEGNRRWFKGGGDEHPAPTLLVGYGALYTGRSDVTASMVTIQSPLCGYNTAWCVELNGDDVSCYSNKIESFRPGLRKCPSLTCRQSVLILSVIAVTNINSRSFTYTTAAKINGRWSLVCRIVTLCKVVFHNVEDLPRCWLYTSRSPSDDELLSVWRSLSSL